MTESKDSELESDKIFAPEASNPIGLKRDRKSPWKIIADRTARVGLILAALGGSYFVEAAAQTEDQGTSQKAEDSIKGLAPSQKPFSENIQEIEDNLPAVSVFGQVEGTEEDLIKNPMNVQSFGVRKNAQGEAEAILAVVNNTIRSGSVRQNSIGYLIEKDPKSTNYVSRGGVYQTGMQSVTSILAESGGGWLLAGNFTFMGGDTAVVHCPRIAGQCTEIKWPYPISGATTDLLRIDEKRTLGVNNEYENGVGLWLLDNDTFEISAIIDPNNPLVYPQAALPEIVAYYPLSQTLQVSSSAIGRRKSGLDLININLDKKTAETKNFSEGLSWLNSKAEYIDNNGQRKIFAGDGFFDDRFHQIDVGANIHLYTITSSLNYRKWGENWGIPNMSPNSFSGNAEFAASDQNGVVHNWIIGAVSTDDPGARSFLGHYRKGDNPETNPETLYLKEIGPASPIATTTRIKECQFIKANSQPGFLCSVDGVVYQISGIKYGGLVFEQINSDYSPKKESLLKYVLIAKKGEVFKSYLPLTVRN